MSSEIQRGEGKLFTGRDIQIGEFSGILRYTENTNWHWVSNNSLHTYSEIQIGTVTGILHTTRDSCVLHTWKIQIGKTSEWELNAHTMGKDK